MSEPIEIPYEQITEITGVDDRERIAQTWRECLLQNGEDPLSGVIDKFISESIPTEPTSTSRQVSEEQPVTESGAEIVQPSETDDMQKAIAASLALDPADRRVDGETSMSLGPTLGGQVSHEDRDLSRVVEQSLIDQRGGWTSDITNPYDRMRHGDNPVGLKNVGNTCWFNAVIQALFAIETFRNLVIQYKKDLSPLDQNEPVQKCVGDFMEELRQLFALLLTSERRYIDPSTTLHALQESFSEGQAGQVVTGHQQQDVSEFQHKLLELLEMAYQNYGQLHTESAALTEESQPAVGAQGSQLMDVDVQREKDSRNEMIRLFYGKVKSFKQQNGASVCTKCEDFGQWPLYLSGFTDVHNCLQHSLASNTVDPPSSNTVDPPADSTAENPASHTPETPANITRDASPEHWFSRLPPVFTFELSRITFDSTLNQAVKLNGEFHFPEILYFDRYMEENKEEVIQKREKLSKLNKEKQTLEAIFNGYMKYGENGTAIETILKDTSAFVLSAQENSAGQNPSTKPPSEPFGSSGAISVTPRPDSVTPDESRVIQSCLTRWLSEVQSATRKLSEDIGRLQNEIDCTYEQPHLKKYPYRLHAVMIHEGDASTGHYWSYVYSRSRATWIRYNDIAASPASWADLVREGKGGTGTASAYCLMYISEEQLVKTYRTIEVLSDISGQSANRSEANASTSNQSENQMEVDGPITGHPVLAAPTPDTSRSPDSLPPDLRDVVLRDNQAFADERARWDAETVEMLKPIPTSDSITGPNEAVEPVTVIDLDSGHPAEYQAAAQARTVLMLFNKSSEKKVNGMIVRNSLEEAVSTIWQRYARARDDFDKVYPQTDHRSHFVVYLMLTHAEEIPQRDYEMLIVDLFYRIRKNHDTNMVPKSTLENSFDAALRLRDYRKADAQFFDRFIKYHQEYSMFRRGFAGLYSAISLFTQCRYEEALPLIQNVLDHNSQFLSSFPPNRRSRYRSLSVKLLKNLQRCSLKHLNDLAIETYRQEDVDYIISLQNIITDVLPILDRLQESDEEEDRKCLHEFKDRWVNLLTSGEDGESKKMDTLKDFIAQIFEPSQLSVKNVLGTLDTPIDLGNRYRKAFDVLMSHEDFLVTHQETG